MKIRGGFVSNSSSSSFTTVGEDIENVWLVFNEDCVKNPPSVPFDAVTANVKPGDRVELSSTKEGWTKEFDVIKMEDVNTTRMLFMAEHVESEDEVKV